MNSTSMKICPCWNCKGAFVSRSTYFRHRNRFYSSKEKVWIRPDPKSVQRLVLDESSDEEITISKKSKVSCNDEEDVTTPLDTEQIYTAILAEESSSESEVEDIMMGETTKVEDSVIEIWEDSDNDSDHENGKHQTKDENEEVVKVVKVLSLFLIIFQLTYKVSDAAINVLLKFLAMFVGLLATVSKSAYVENLKARIPKTVKTAQNTSGLSFPAFTQYVSCTKCSSLYTTEDCKIVSGREVSSKVCSYIQFPNHPQYSQRRPCNTILLKSVSQFGKTFLYPFQTYCYSNLIASLEYLIKQNEFITNCNKWRSRKVHNDILIDIYDGRVWKDFGNFLAESETNFLLGLNVDWFQPFTNCQYSVGAIYLCILNIPRSSRFKEKYILLNGIIPGPHEPKKTINTYLDKLVNELLLLWKGVCMTDATGKNVNVRAALCMVACDIPALRKCLGFAGEKANKGCSKCLKLFPTPTFSSKTDYSGFNMEDWIMRSNDQHKQAIQAYKKGKTKSEQNQAIKSTGVREGFLCHLPYFDPVRYHVIDPMHNLLLGTAKYMMELWKKREILSKSDFDKIQEWCDSFTLPSDIGRVPYKISSGFAGFKADQWRIWTTVFSLSALREVLPDDLYTHWGLFVHACSILCSRVISTSAIEKSHALLVEFCQQFQVLYGNQNCTMNLHLHCHLKECLYDYGPVYSFWLFSFERLNGIMGSYPTNNRSVEVQLMNKHLRSWQLKFTELI